MAGQATAILQDVDATLQEADAILQEAEMRLIDEIREASPFALDRRRGEID
jgi:hypothetical protein